MEVLSQYWVYLLPLIAIQLTLQIIATVSLVRADTVRGGNKAVWAIVIWAFQVIGPLAYFALGRKE